MTVAQAQQLKGAIGGSPIDVTCIDTIRTLAMDAVQAANSGHPGTPMALAPVAYCLWQEFLRYDPADPTWPNRDRFVLSCGHASMLLYALLHLAEVRMVSEDNRVLDEPSIPLDQIKLFRQLGSRTPGHPEHELAGGIETTTGPLGQGVGNSVGMAATGKWLAARYSRPGFEGLFGFRVWALCSDGDLMEGVSHEAASLAGHLKLSNLCWIYDNNRITIEGKTDLAYSDDVGSRFEGYNWNVLRVSDANDLNELRRAYKTAVETTDRPTMIIVDSHIGYGAPHKQDTASAHGEALGEEEVKLTKRFYGWPEDAKFLVPDGVYDCFRAGVGKRGKAARGAWDAQFADYKKKHPDLADQLDRMRTRKLPDGWDRDIPTFPADPKGLATRDSGGKVLNAIAKNLPWLIGG
jgi:transketolase